MPRLLLAALALATLLLPASGCYRYDARAKNLTGHDVRVSIHKGFRNREVSTAVLGAGASAGWTGSLNGPVMMRVTSAGETVDVGLPRRAHTVVEVSDVNGELVVMKTIGDESWRIGAEEAPESAPDDAPADAPADAPSGDGEMVDLVEPGEG